MSKVYVYVVDRDFGFAPNPFHGYCTLATCKPMIRKRAHLGDWVIGMGGSRLKATGRCIFAMRVTDITTFNKYWENIDYLEKIPLRNGSRKMMVGDNIYHYDSSLDQWLQTDSHHSNIDGNVNLHNVRNDTKSDNVLISQHFYYFGEAAPVIPSNILDSIAYKNGRNYRVYDIKDCATLIGWLEDSFHKSLNLVIADPFDFTESERRYSVEDNKVS